MSLLLPHNRLARPPGLLRTWSPSIALLPRPARRYVSTRPGRRKNVTKSNKGKKSATTETAGLALHTMNPAMANYVKKRREVNDKAAVDHQGLPTESDVLPGESLFDELEESRERQLELAAKEKPIGSRQALEKRNWETMDPVLNPDPENRVRWERKMVIEQVRKDGRLTKDEMLRRTERQCMSRSAQLKTSTKKLVMLARQVQGMTVSEALLQMRFSKKRIAEEVSKHLEHARDEAIVKWGMGLGKAEGRMGHSIEIQLADGKRKKIKDRTDIYIDQAWVGRGEYEPELEHRARGKVNVLRKPYANITFLLKEEASRIRLWEERKRREETSRLWLHLPDRPVSQQRQYLLW